MREYNHTQGVILLGDTGIYRYFYTVSTVSPTEFYSLSLKTEVKYGHGKDYIKTQAQHYFDRSFGKIFDRLCYQGMRDHFVLVQKAKPTTTK